MTVLEVYNNPYFYDRSALHFVSFEQWHYKDSFYFFRSRDRFFILYNYKDYLYILRSRIVSSIPNDIYMTSVSLQRHLPLAFGLSTTRYIFSDGSHRSFIFNFFNIPECCELDFSPILQRL